MDDKLVSFKGTVARSVYVTEDFSVYAMNVDAKKYDVKMNKYNNVSICGELPNLVAGVEYEIMAKEETNKYGVSYRVSGIRRDLPVTKDGVRSFLEEITSTQFAQEISNAYPDIIERVKEGRTDDIDLSKMRGIGRHTFDKIMEKVRKNVHLVDLASEFHGILTINMLNKIYEKYPSIEKLRQKLSVEPYSTLTQVSGIGFKTADEKILLMQEEGAIDFGYDIKTSGDRCLACIIYLLEQNECEGHTKMDVRALRLKINDMVPECSDKFYDALDDGRVYFNDKTYEVALKRTRDMEASIAKTIMSNIRNDNVWHCDASEYKDIDGVELTDEQVSVLDNLCKYNISILNGYSGSGKTMCTKAIIKMLEDMHKSYMLMAPTGKAAKVMEEFTNRKASTIHRALKYVPGKGFGVNAYNKIEADVVIVDEMSMVDVELFYHLLEAIDFSMTKLLMIGDNAQLPSVGCGNLLHDFMATKAIPTVSLSKIFRYKEGGLMRVATDIRMGRYYLDGSMSHRGTSFGSNKDYVFLDVIPDHIVQTTMMAYKKALDRGYDVTDIQVITPKNIGKYGADKLNPMLQKIANPNASNGHGFKNGDFTYYVGDLVIECVNNYDAPIANDPAHTAFVANGETGIIKGMTNDTVTIDFDGILVAYTKPMMNMIKLGYAITCHKSQGSSINYVILITPRSDVYTMNSNLLYVGCTRAKKWCVHIGQLETVNMVIKKKANFTRHTFMQQMIKGYVHHVNEGK